MKSKLLALFVLLAFLSGCTHYQALIQSEPPGAMVTINGTEIGTTPVLYDYSLGTKKQHQMHISRQGYEPVDQSIKADVTDARAMKRWLIAGIIWSPLWIGTFFTKRLKETYLFVMKQSKPQLTAMLE